MDFLKCYQVVGVAPDCTWEELRIAYRRQVQKHHPDRYQQQPDRQLIAKERMLELNKTYDTLAEYYKKNGHLPATGLKKTASKYSAQARTETIRHNTAEQANYTSPDIRPTKPQHTARKTSWGLVIVVSLLVYYFFGKTYPNPQPPIPMPLPGIHIMREIAQQGMVHLAVLTRQDWQSNKITSELKQPPV